MDHLDFSCGIYGGIVMAGGMDKTEAKETNQQSPVNMGGEKYLRI